MHPKNPCCRVPHPSRIPARIAAMPISGWVWGFEFVANFSNIFVLPIPSRSVRDHGIAA